MISDYTYPEDLTITINDYSDSRVDEILDGIERKVYNKYWPLLSNEARKAFRSKDMKTGKILWLLADICSMNLNPTLYNEPFQLRYKIKGKFSAFLECFSSNDIIFLENISDVVKDFRLKARINDLLWLVKNPRNPKHAISAIDSYNKFSLKYDLIHDDGRDAWERAIRLCLILKDGAKDQIESIRDVLYNLFNYADIKDRFYAFWLSELLLVSQIDNGRAEIVSMKLECYGDIFIQKKEWYKGRDYYELSIQWNKKCKRTANNNLIISKIAQAWRSEAEHRSSDSNMVAGLFLQNAIKNYRKIPGKDRDKYNADKHIDEIYKKMNHHNKIAIGEMKLPEAVEILGEDLHFEFKALLTEQTGANLRNNIAHGLIEEVEANSIYTIYLWWLSLRLVVSCIPWSDFDLKE